MCIMLYVKPLLCSSIPYIYGQLEGGTSGLSICAFCYLLNIFSAVVFHRCMVNWRRGSLVDVNSTICETSVVYWYSIHLWSIGGGTSGLSICAFCYLLNLCGVVVFHRCMVNWKRGLGRCEFCYM